MQRFKDLWPGLGVVAGSRLDVSLVSGSGLTLISGVAGLLAGLKLTSTQNPDPNYPPENLFFITICMIVIRSCTRSLSPI